MDLFIERRCQEKDISTDELMRSTHPQDWFKMFTADKYSKFDDSLLGNGIPTHNITGEKLSMFENI